MAHITFSSALENIALANDFLHKTLANEGLDFSMIELAIEEVLVNVISYAYKNPETLPHQEMLNKIEFGVRKVRFDNKPFYCIWVKDWGHPFDPFEEAQLPDLDLDLDERPIGGLGVHLVKTVSKHQCYSADDGTNIVEMFFSANHE